MIENVLIVVTCCGLGLVALVLGMRGERKREAAMTAAERKDYETARQW